MNTKEARDCISYDKNYDDTIDKCLNCTKKKCTGNCYEVNKSSQENKDFFVRTMRTLGNGEVKYGYIYSITRRNEVKTVSDPKYSRLFAKTYSGAYYLMNRAQKYIKKGTKLDIVKKSEVTKNE